MKNLTLVILILTAHLAFGQTKKRTKVQRLDLYKEINFNSSLCEQSYYSIKLAGFDIGLNNDKKWWAKYEPILFIELETDDQKFYRIFGSEIGSGSTDPKNDNGFRTSQNILLIGPFPFKGDNSVKIKVRLYATKVEDKIQNVIGAITPITKLIGGQVEVYSKLTTEIANHVSGLLNNYKPLVSFEGEWNPYNGNDLDKSVFRSGFFIIHSVEDEAKFQYKNINIGDDGQIEYLDNGVSGYLFQKNVDYAILEFEHQLYRTDIATSKFSYYSHLQDALKESASGRDTLKVEMLFDKFCQNLLEDRSFTAHDKVKMILENELSIETQLRIKYPKYNGKNLVTPFCTDGLYKSLTAKKILSEMAIRKSLIENKLIIAGQPLDSMDYGSLLAKLPNTSKNEVINKLNLIGIGVDDKTLESVETILKQINEPIINSKSADLVIKRSELQIINPSNNSQQQQQQQQLQQQQLQQKIHQIQQQQQQMSN
jgi:hypothetical protein